LSQGIVSRNFLLIGLSIIVSPFSFFQAQMESMSGNAFELCLPHFCYALKPLYSVYVDTIPDKFILRAFSAKVDTGFA